MVCLQTQPCKPASLPGLGHLGLMWLEMHSVARLAVLTTSTLVSRLEGVGQACDSSSTGVHGLQCTSCGGYD